MLTRVIKECFKLLTHSAGGFRGFVAGGLLQHSILDTVRASSFMQDTHGLVVSFQASCARLSGL